MDKPRAKTPAYDRVKNANNNGDVFIKTAYWTPEVEDDFESWAEKRGSADLASILDDFLGSSVAVSFKALNGSICATLAHQPSKDASLPYLLTGWSDTALDALFVAMFKLEVELQGVWEAPPSRPPSRRH